MELSFGNQTMVLWGYPGALPLCIDVYLLHFGLGSKSLERAMQKPSNPL